MIQFNPNFPNPQTKVTLEVVFTLEPHPELGLLFQVKAVEKLSSGKFSMNSEKVRLRNADYYGLSKKEIDILKIIESYEPDALIERFYKGKKRINSSVFFEQVLTDELKNKEVRPYIEAKLIKIIKLLRDTTVYYWGTGTLNHWIPIHIQKKAAEVVFKIDRKESGMSYSCEVSHVGNNLKLQNAENTIVVAEPAHIIINGSLYHFKGDVDAKKIATFFNKKEVLVPSSSEQIYLQKFILPLAEVYDVKATGITVNALSVKRRAILKLSVYASKINLSLVFEYGDLSYPLHVVTQGKANLEKGPNDWIINVNKRDKNWEGDMVDLLEDNGLVHFQGAMFGIDPELSLENFLSQTLIHLQRIGFDIDQSELKQPFNLSQPVMSYTVSEDNDWFDLQISVRFGKFEVPFKKLRPNILNGNRFLELPDGSMAIIPIEWMQKLSPVLDCAADSGDKVRLGRFHYGLLETFDEIGVNRSGERMDAMVAAFKKAEQIKVPSTLKANLRNYQSTGLQWLVALNENKFGGLLADDMGLGKTVQTLAFFEWFILNKRPAYRIDYQKENQINSVITEAPTHLTDPQKPKTIPFLVVAPTSLLHNWMDEIKKFTNLSAFVYAGNHRNRYVWEYFHDFEVILTTYGTIRNDKDVLNRVHFDVVVFDEAQNLKNPGSITAKVSADLNASQKILLTGTPIENSTVDLWSLMNIANGGLLGTFGKFQKNFIQKIEKKRDESKVKELRELTAPFILRRTKEQVAKELPPRHEQILYCSMEGEQSKLYEKTKSYFRNELMKTIKEKGMEKSKLYVLKGLLRLRQLANHPLLVDEHFIGESGKFNLIMENLQNIVVRGNKVLVFSQFVSHLKLFKEKLNALEIPFAYIDGSISSDERASEVKRFQEDEHCQVFLISLKAGGVGLNLTAADYVFLSDPWWNPAVERQAMDRAHRIGRSKPVFVYKFISQDTVEEKIIKLQERKRALADEIVSEDNAGWLSSIEQSDLEEILN